MEITQIDIISWMERIFFATISLVFVAVALKRRTVTWRWQKYQNSAQSLLLGDVTNNFSSNSAVNWPMFGKNYWLTKCFVFTTNFEPIVKQSVANNTLLSQILVKKPIYFYILDLYFRTGKNRVLDLYFRTEGVPKWKFERRNCFHVFQRFFWEKCKTKCTSQKKTQDFLKKILSLKWNLTGRRTQ